MNPAYSGRWLWGSSFPPNTGPNDKCRLSPILAPALSGIRLESHFQIHLWAAFSFFFFLILFIYLFMAVLGLSFLCKGFL